jgi:hypothetical protein
MQADLLNGVSDVRSCKGKVLKTTSQIAIEGGVSN